jgi:CRISPR system Cascade subunit CasC
LNLIFTAVDDLNNKEEDIGSGHMGEQGFASALFYTYICISRDLLVETLAVMRNWPNV